ncbi:MAG: hypothetical protein COT38_03210 [Candidatus Omnitrophica bacterium CG08_land_8_20_14_0_20_41_16]|nr:MAG: hypothetical protein COT38_03210 [Candidatus Omnitrophica bacterium CG08_land_8_20_14_0_20_41_16]
MTPIFWAISQQAHRTTLDLPDDLYFFLKQEALERQKQDKEASIAAIMRELIEEYKTKQKRSKK